MFGIDRKVKREAALDKELASVISRERPINALDALAKALGTATIPVDLSKCAVALDSSVFLRLASHDKAADVIDYLNGRHASGFIIPGQSIQEFWNNKYNVVPSLARKLQASFEAFCKQIEELDGEFSDFTCRFQTIISDFEVEHGHVFDEQTIAKTFRMLDALQAKAEVPYVNREKYQSFALHRQNTKTPPGFRDKAGNDGDFFVWLDALRGVQIIRKSGARPEWLVFVTNDKKEDWSRDGMAHPLLTAELQAACAMRLCIVDLDKFVKLVEKTTE